MHNKLPEVTLCFWVLKICATTLGETGGDLFAQTLQIGYATTSLILISIFLVALFTQLKSRDYHPLLYWTVILLTSTVGTTMSDYMDRTLGFGYARGSLLLVTILVVILTVWKFSTGSLSVQRITTFKAELFYWSTILFSNTLGTALGDFLADSSGLGFAGGAFLITCLIAAIALAYYLTPISRVGLFWAAFVLTRPLGATFGDFLTKPHAKGGLEFGTLGSSLVLIILFMGFILFTLRQQQKEPAPIKSNNSDSLDD